MTFLLKKMLRDIKKNWMQFVTVFLMSALSVTIFSGMASVWHGMDKEVKSYSEKTNLADVWIYGAGIDEEDVDKIKKLDGVEDVTLSSEVPSTLKSGNGNVKLISVNNDKVIKPLTMSGEKWSYKGNGIYLDNSFAKANDFKIGDSIDLKIGGLEKTFEIKGTALHSEYILYRFCNGDCT